jgi:hypothetical protein
MTYSFRPYHGPGVDPAPGENEYQEHFLEVKAAGAWGWQPHRLHVQNVMKSGSLDLLEPSGPHGACYRTPLPCLVGGCHALKKVNSTTQLKQSCFLSVGLQLHYFRKYIQLKVFSSGKYFQFNSSESAVNGRIRSSLYINFWHITKVAITKDWTHSDESQWRVPNNYQVT